MKLLEKIPTDEIIKYKDQGLILPEFYYKEKGYKIDLIGEEKVNQKKYYNIKVETNSETLNYLIGRSDFSIFRLISNQSYTEVKESIKINGIKLIKSSIYKSGKFKREALRVNTKLNIEINDSIFDLK
ncbi:MAG: hypothetical protein GY756_15535 [bacterium]|nr:hypothetical protein [bacterium]